MGLSSESDAHEWPLIGWRGVEFYAPPSLRLAAERVGPQSSYSIFTDMGYPRLELIVDRSRSYGFADLGPWIDRLVKSREKDKWEILDRDETTVGGHRGLRVTGTASGARFQAYAWSCAGRLNFLKINMLESEEDLSRLLRSIKCHRPDPATLIALYEFQIRVPTTLWTTSLIATAGDLCLFMEDQSRILVIERGGPVEVLGRSLEQWLKDFHQKKLDRYKVFIGSRAVEEEAQPHDALNLHIHPKGLIVRRKVVGVTRAWICDVNSRYWAYSIISLERGPSIKNLPPIEVNCHFRKI